jgi:hypothetical protein
MPLAFLQLPSFDGEGISGKRAEAFVSPTDAFSNFAGAIVCVNDDTKQ